MTLIVAASASRDFLLAASDRSVVYLEPGAPLEDVKPDPIPPPMGPKVRQVSDMAIACTAGCLVRSEHMHALLAERISRSDDAETCIFALTEAWNTAEIAPLPSWTFADGQQRIADADDRMPFGAHLLGFQPDGSALTATLTRNTVTEGPPLAMSDGREPTFTLAFPLFASALEVEELQNVDRDKLTFRKALEHTLHVHRTFRDAYPEIVSETFDITALRWLGEGIPPAAARLTIGANFPDPIDLMLDATQAALEQPPADPVLAALT